MTYQITGIVEGEFKYGIHFVDTRFFPFFGFCGGGHEMMVLRGCCPVASPRRVRSPPNIFKVHSLSTYLKMFSWVIEHTATILVSFILVLHFRIHQATLNKSNKIKVIQSTFWL